MPQMAPLSWTILFLLFSILFITATVKIYFSKDINSINKEMKMTCNNYPKFNWKW